MKVFISWSGKFSKECAEGLRHPATRSFGPSGLIKKWCDFIGTLLKNPPISHRGLKEQL